MGILNNHTPCNSWVKGKRGVFDTNLPQQRYLRCSLCQLSMLEALASVVLIAGIACSAVFWLEVQKLRRESAHARSFDGDFELTMMRMHRFSSQFLKTNQKNAVYDFFCACASVLSAIDFDSGHRTKTGH